MRLLALFGIGSCIYKYCVMLPADLDEWDEIACESYDLRKIIIENKNNKLKLFSPKPYSKYYSTAPYYYDGGVTISNNIIEPDIIKAIHNIIEDNNLDYVLLKSRGEIDVGCFDNFQIDLDYSTFLLSLSSGKESIWKDKLKSKTRNQVRKAAKYSFDVEFGERELLDDFYYVISRGWRDLGTPTHSRNFYKLILEKLSDRSKILVIFHHGEPISCALLLMVDNVIYHPYSCSLKKYKSTCVNNLLYWEIIKFACDMDYKYFDMGRSRKGQGTFNYKLSWGAEPVMLQYTYILREGSDLPSYDTCLYRTAIRLWKSMPLYAANYLGPIFIKNIL